MMNTSKTLKMLMLLLTLWILTGIGYAQNPTIIALNSDVSAMQTGQTYPVEINLIDSPEVWVLDVSIEYDSDMVYIMGSVAGSPVTQGDFFSPKEDSITVRNFVEDSERIEYTLSMLGQAQPPSGSGGIGTFLIYPLHAGTTTITISSAQLTAIERSDNGEVESSDIEFAIVQLDLSITGDDVDPPEETPPTPTLTPTRAVFQGENPDSEPTLVSVTLPPTGSENTETGETDNIPSTNMIVPIALILIVVGVVGIAALLFVGRRK